MPWRDGRSRWHTARMRAFCAAVAPLLASLLLIATVIAPAHCLARAAPAGERPAELCQPASLFGHAPAEQPPTRQETGICVVCTQQIVAMPAEPAITPAAAPVWQPARLLLPAPRAPPSADHFQPRQPRAPPAA